MSRIENIIVKSFLKEADSEELLALEEWKNRSEKNRTFVDSLTAYWVDPLAAEADEVRFTKAQRKLMGRIGLFSESRRRVKAMRYRTTRVAAAIAVVLVSSSLSIYIAYESGLGFSPARVVVSTDAGQQSRTELPDGSIVWLNSETTLSYIETKDRRNVTLEGEATFEVSKKQFRPFVVEADDTDIIVTGTKFNVMNYPETNFTEVALLSGSIKMKVPGWKEEIAMEPGEKVKFREDKRRLTRLIVNPNNSIAWQNGILIFDNEPFSELIRRLERSYDVDVVYDEVCFENIHYTGAINNLSMEKVLEFIKLTINIDYKIDNKTVFIDHPSAR